MAGTRTSMHAEMKLRLQVLPEQGPSGWGADTALLLRALGKVRAGWRGGGGRGSASTVLRAAQRPDRSTRRPAAGAARQSALASSCRVMTVICCSCDCRALKSFFQENTDCEIMEKLEVSKKIMQRKQFKKTLKTSWGCAIIYEHILRAQCSIYFIVSY